MLVVLSVTCALIVAVSLLGGVFPLATVLNHTRLQVYLSFSAGSMLGAAFFHMLPDAIRMGTPETIRWSAVGLLALFFLERFFSFHHHEADHHSEALPRSTSADAHAHSHAHPPSAVHLHPHGEAHLARPLSWGTAAFGLTVHTLVGGLALASAIAADFADQGWIGATGWGVFLATLVHKPADALTIVTLMLGSGASRRLAHLVNLGFALMIPLGVVLFFVSIGHASPVLAAHWTAIVLSFSAGTFLCIALGDLLPELQFHSHDRIPLSIALVAGFLLMVATSVLEFP